MTSLNRLGFFCVLAALAGGVLGFAERATAIGVIYDENFGGLGTDNLNNSTVDFDGTGAVNTTKWVAHSGFKQNGLIPSASVNQGAWLPFAPQAGNTYSLSASLTGVGQDGASVAWMALGFAKLLPANPETGSNRFADAASPGRAWMLFRANNPVGNANMIHLGNNATGTATGPQSPASWTPATFVEGGDIDMQIVLNTNPAIWTATFFAKRPADSLYTQVSAELNLLTQDIAAVGFARTTNTAGTTLVGTITNFTLESIAPLVMSGDVDGNNVVDDVDFGIIRDHLFQTPATRAQGDLTNDNLVDFSDFRQWKTAHGGGSGASASLGGVVPEPASAGLALIVASVGVFAGRRRRAQRNL